MKPEEKPLVPNAKRDTAKKKPEKAAVIYEAFMSLTAYNATEKQVDVQNSTTCII